MRKDKLSLFERVKEIVFFKKKNELGWEANGTTKEQAFNKWKIYTSLKFSSAGIKILL